MSEQLYDDEIAADLLRVAKKCEQYGLPLVAVVEYEPGKRAETRVLPADAGLAMVMLSNLAATGENIDAFFINLARYCDKNGIDTSASIVMQRLKASSSWEKANEP